MESKLNIVSATLVALCIVVGVGLYYFTHMYEKLSGVTCEANAKFTYFNSQGNSNPPKNVRLSLKMNYIFFSDNKGVLTLTGVANSGDKKFFVSRGMKFSYLSRDDFYKFTYSEERLSVRDTLPSSVYTYFFSRDANFYHIRHVDKTTLMFSNVYSPMFLCNINS